MRHVTFRRKPKENPREAAMYHILDYMILSTSNPCSHPRVLGSVFRCPVVGIQRCLMSFAKTIAVLMLSLMCIHCSS